MSRSNPNRLPSPFTLFSRLLALPERVAGLFRRPDAKTPPAQLNLETMEDRVGPDGRPLSLPVIFAGAGEGESPVVKAYDAQTGNLKFARTVYSSSFEGGVRVAAADFNRDGIPDVAVAPGPGHAPRIKVLDGATGELIAGPLGNFLAYSSDVTGGVFVAGADVNGDAVPELITAAATASGTRVKAFDNLTGEVVADFHLQGQLFHSGVTLAAADLTGDKKAEVILGAQSGGWVMTFDPLTGHVIDGPLGSFRAFGSGYSGAAVVGADALAGDVNGDGTPDLAVGTDADSKARVRVFDGATGDVLYDFKPFGNNTKGGARVALAYVDDDRFADVVVGTGPGTKAKIRVFSGATGEQLAAPLGEYNPFTSSRSGVFVAATNDPSPPFPTYYFNGSTSTPSLVAGQSLTVSALLTGATNSPTGTVTFRLYDSSLNLLNTWAQTLTPTTAPQSVTAPFTLSLANASYSMTAAYSGNYAPIPESNILSVTVSAPSNVVPLPVSLSCVWAEIGR